MTGTVTARSLEPGDVFTLKPHRASGHPGPVGHSVMDVQVDRPPVVVDPGHVTVFWRSCRRLRGVTTFDRLARVPLVSKNGTEAAA